MTDEPRPFIREMLKEGIQELGGAASNTELRDWVLEKYPGTNANSINASIILLTVNHASRIHYPENQSPRVADDERYDVLYRPERGRLELYDPERHGLWQIVEREDGGLAVAPVSEEAEPDEEKAPLAFALEAHLQALLAKNLHIIEEGLELFVDDSGRTGLEYPTSVGRIDLLVLDRHGTFLVIELKVGRSPDEAASQLMRYRNWVARHLADGARVRSCLVAQRISDKIRYALAGVTDLMLKEYDLRIDLRDVEPLG